MVREYVTLYVCCLRTLRMALDMYNVALTRIVGIVVAVIFRITYNDKIRVIRYHHKYSRLVMVTFTYYPTIGC